MKSRVLLFFFLFDKLNGGFIIYWLWNTKYRKFIVLLWSSFIYSKATSKTQCHSAFHFEMLNIKIRLILPLFTQLWKMQSILNQTHFLMQHIHTYAIRYISACHVSTKEKAEVVLWFLKCSNIDWYVHIFPSISLMTSLVVCDSNLLLVYMQVQILLFSYFLSFSFTAVGF